MPRKTPPPRLVELTGEIFPSLEAAQQTARTVLAHDLAATLRGLLDRGALVVQDGKLQPTKNER